MFKLEKTREGGYRWVQKLLHKGQLVESEPVGHLQGVVKHLAKGTTLKQIQLSSEMGPKQEPGTTLYLRLQVCATVHLTRPAMTYWAFTVLCMGYTIILFYIYMYVHVLSKQKLVKCKLIYQTEWQRAVLHVAGRIQTYFFLF